MTLACVSNGKSYIEESIFENRFMHVPELNRLGADIQVKGNNAIINGNCSFIGAEVMATDLRASVSLILAALIAKGKTKINRIYHLDRGYENIDYKLQYVERQLREEKMEIRQNWSPVKLKAVDDQDLQVFSQFCLSQ